MIFTKECIKKLVESYAALSGCPPTVDENGNFDFSEENVQVNREFVNMVYQEISSLHALLLLKDQLVNDLDALDALQAKNAAVSNSTEDGSSVVGPRGSSNVGGDGGSGGTTGGDSSNDKPPSVDPRGSSNVGGDGGSGGTTGGDSSNDKPPSVDTSVGQVHVTDDDEQSSDSETILSFPKPKTASIKTPQTAKISNKTTSIVAHDNNDGDVDDDVPIRKISFDKKKKASTTEVATTRTEAATTEASTTATTEASAYAVFPTSPFDDEWLNKDHDDPLPKSNYYSKKTEHLPATKDVELNNMTRTMIRRASSASKNITTPLTEVKFFSLIKLVIKSDDDDDGSVPDNASFLSWMDFPENQEGYSEYLAWQMGGQERDLRRLQQVYGLVETASIKVNHLIKAVHMIRKHIRSNITSVGVHNVYSNDNDTVVASLGDGSTTGGQIICLVCKEPKHPGGMVNHLHAYDSRDPDIQNCVDKRWKFWAVDFWHQLDDDPYAMQSFTKKKHQSQFFETLRGVKKMDLDTIKKYMLKKPFFKLFIQKFFMWNDNEQVFWTTRIERFLTEKEKSSIKEANEDDALPL